MHFFLLALYILVIVVISVSSRKKIRGVSDFLLGSRSINPWMSAFSYGTAYFSAVMFIGYAGKLGWNFGISALWIAVGNSLIGSFLAWHVLGKRTREMTHRLNASTMPEFIGVRYDSKALKIVTALVIFIFLVPYSAAVYKGLGYLFEEIFHMNFIYALLLMTVLTAFYLFAGGFVASTKIDFFQGMIMLVGVALLLFFIITNEKVGSIGLAVQKLAAIDPQLGQAIGPPGLISIASLVLVTSLGSWGMPSMVHKLYTIKDEKSIFAAKWVSTGFAVVITFGGYFTGVCGRLILDNQRPESYDMIVPQMIANSLPQWVSAIIFVLIISASMSTLASLVLASSSAIAVDLVKGVLFPEINKQGMVKLMRLLCIFFVGLSFMMSIQDGAILSLAVLSWGAVSGCLLAPYLWGLFSKKITRIGVWSGIIISLTITTVGVIKLGFDSPSLPTVGVLSLMVPLILVPLVSLFTKNFEEEHLEYIFEGKMS
ncbi:MAG: sodium:solute symporter [Peptostreptococcales bacterium]